VNDEAVQRCGCIGRQPSRAAKQDAEQNTCGKEHVVVHEIAPYRRESGKAPEAELAIYSRESEN
jgi:hypothetical protein